MRRRALPPVLLALLLAGCASTGGGGPVMKLQPGQRPALTTDEAGLWMLSDRQEKSLATSGRVVTDPALNAYVRHIVCRLAPAYCREVRLYIVHTPYFNATMAPNGYMEVWTGLLLRAQNEAELAYVLGHEIGHFLRRHSVQQWRRIRDTSDALVFFQVATAAAGVGYVGSISQLIAAGALMSYSRDDEREADQVGFDLMTRAGYDPNQAPRIWEALLREQKASKKDKPSIFFATHPSSEERVATLRRLAAESKPTGHEIGRDAYAAAIAPFRATWLRDELQRREFAESEVLFDRLLRQGRDPGLVQFYRGELFRLRGGKGDLDRAVAAYRAAIASGAAPPEAQRSLGLVHWKAGRKAQARAAFTAYLAAAPKAADAAMIRSYLGQL